MSRAWRTVGAVAAIILIPGGIYAGITGYFLTKMQYGIYGITNLSFKSGVLKFGLVVWVKNPSATKINIEGYEFDIAINGVNVAKISDAKEKELASKGTSYLNIPIEVSADKIVNKVDWGKIAKLFISGETDKIFISIKGKFMGGVLKIPISTKVNITKSIKQIAEEQRKEEEKKKRETN